MTHTWPYLTDLRCVPFLSVTVTFNPPLSDRVHVKHCGLQIVSDRLVVIQLEEEPASDIGCIKRADWLTPARWN